MEHAMWIELIVAVCLYSDPGVCRELQFQFVEERSLDGCMARAQPYMANWSAGHPKWRVVRWKCEFSSSGKRDI
jgi:hypothetical protein